MVRLRGFGKEIVDTTHGVGVMEAMMQSWMPNQRFAAFWAWVRRRWLELRRARPARRLRVAETLSLGEKRQLLLVECGDRRLLIGTAGNFVATLAELERIPTTQRAGHE